MAFKVTTRNVGDVIAIDLSGRLDIGEGAAALRDTIQKCSAEASKVLVNLSDLTFIDTAGLGELAAAHARAQREETSLKLAAVPKRVYALLQMTGLDGILDICESEAEALEAWGESHFPGERTLSEVPA